MSPLTLVADREPAPHQTQQWFRQSVTSSRRVAKRGKIGGRAMGLGVSRFFFPDPAELADVNHAGLAGIPFLFDIGFELLHVENRYLRERARGLWPNLEDGVTPRRDMAPNTLISIARRLHHFRDWSDLNRKRWQTMRYEDVLVYQDDQTLGRGAFRGRAVSATTANARADIATDFLAWARAQGLRGSFEFPLQTIRRLVEDRSSNAKFVVTKRFRAHKGRSPSGNREEATLLELPERPAIVEWLESLRHRKRPEPEAKVNAKYLICRFIVDTGVRLHEAVAVEITQWPSHGLISRCSERGRRHVHMRLLVTKSGTKRTIRVSITLAALVRRWIDRTRGTLLSKGIEAGRTGKTSRLFLSDSPGFEGIPIQRHTVYDCFREVEPRPEGWHPHMARHAYACHRMRDIIAAELKADPGGKGPAWINSRGQFAIDLIARQLGHVSKETTKIYLSYLQNSIGMIEENDHWHHELDSNTSR